ncbi:X-linked retinitis pigmentosa GTPase regulator [Plutella xylostella]|uniref:X-linked retinitis pigmentosa GTPase regulator n=1 Tax=Plutella xylostella TaxID=51655 RepID=UPI002032F68A|nr:X-linked retinitis pigmentosa GTPase regulator [Plutella xylostella]
MIDDIPDTGAVFTFGRSHFAEDEPSHFFIKSDPVVAISCGDDHSAVICQNGRVFVFGGNSWGQLGLGHRDEVARPSCVKWLKPQRALFVACGRAHTVFVTDSHAIYTVGCNSEGQLGTGSTESHSMPQCVELPCEDARVKQVSAGSNHTAILTESGRVFVCGSNSEGQLGLGEDTRSCLQLTELAFMETIAYVECGYYHTVFITSKGAVFVTGENEGQKLGTQNTASNIYVPEVLPLDIPIKDACCGANHTFLLSMDESKILAFGSNEKGQLGLPKEVENVVEPTEIDMDKMFDGFQLKLVACGAMHTAFVTDNGLLYTCGEARHNKLCLDDVDDANNANDTLPNQYLPKRVTSMNGFIVDNVACGGCHTLLSATKGSNADFTNNDFNVVSEQERQGTVTELPPLQKIPAALTTTDIPHTVEDIANSNIEAGTNNTDGMNGNPSAPEENTSIDSLEANVSGSHIVNINELEMDSNTPDMVPDLKDEDSTLPDEKQDMDIIDEMNKVANDTMAKVEMGVQDMKQAASDKMEDAKEMIEDAKEKIDDAKDKMESAAEDIMKKAAALDPSHKLEEIKSLGLPDKAIEIANSPPPKSPIIQDLLHVPDLSHMGMDSDDGQKSETGQSENETIPCGSDKSSPQAGKTKTQAVLPIVRSDGTMEAMEESDVVVKEKGRFARIFQSLKDKENSCMSKGKVIEESVQETVQKGITSAEETVHKVEETVETEIRNHTNSRTCTIL